MKYTLEYQIPEEQAAFIDAANGTALRQLLQEHLLRLTTLVEDGRKNEAKLASTLLEELHGKLDVLLRLPD